MGRRCFFRDNAFFYGKIDKGGVFFMYEKLGEMLNEVLENGGIGLDKVNEEDKKQVDDKINADDKISVDDKINADDEKIGLHTGKIKEKKTFDRKIDEKIHISSQKQQISTGKVIKMHKYTQNMHIPQEVLQALGTLHLVYPADWNIIKKQYHTLLKSVHPDTNTNKTTIQTTEHVFKNIHPGTKKDSTTPAVESLSIDELKKAYNTLKAWYKK